MKTGAGSLDAAFAVVDKVLRLVGAPSVPTLEVLTEYLDLDVSRRPGAALEVRGMRIVINGQVPHLPQLARGIARHIVHCGLAGDVDEDALAVAFIERCELDPRIPVVRDDAPAQSERGPEAPEVYRINLSGGVCA